MAKMKVFELKNVINEQTKGSIESKDILDFIENNFGIKKSHSSNLEENEVQFVKNHFTKGAQLPPFKPTVKPAGAGTNSQTTQGVKPAGVGSNSQTTQGVKPAGAGTNNQTTQGVKPAGAGTNNQTTQGAKPAGAGTNNQTTQGAKPAGAGTNNQTTQGTKPAGVQAAAHQMQGEPAATGNASATGSQATAKQGQTSGQTVGQSAGQSGPDNARAATGQQGTVRQGQNNQNTTAQRPSGGQGTMRQGQQGQQGQNYSSGQGTTGRPTQDGNAYQGQRPRPTGDGQGYQGSRPRQEGQGYQGQRSTGDGQGYQGQRQQGQDGNRPSRPSGEGTGYQGQRPRQDGQGYQGQRPRQDGQGYQGQRPRQDGQGYQGQRPAGDGQGYQGSRPRQDGQGYQGQRSSGDGQGYQGQRPRQDGQGYQGQRPRQDGQGYQGSRPRQDGQGYQGQRPSGDGQGYQGSRPRQDGQGYQGQRPTGDGQGYQGSRPRQDGQGYQGSRPRQDGQGYQGQRPTGGYQGNRPQGAGGSRPMGQGGQQGRGGYAGAGGGYSRPSNGQRPGGYSPRGFEDMNKDDDDNKPSYGNRSQAGKKGTGGQRGAGERKNFDQKILDQKVAEKNDNSNKRNRDRINKEKNYKDRSIVDRDEENDDIKVKIAPKKGQFIQPKIAPTVEEVIKVIQLPEVLTIKELADKMKKPSAALIKKLFLSGKVVTLNQEITYEEAEEIALDYEIIAEREVVVNEVEELLKEDEEDPATMEKRPPVVCVMGHVDHGKTSLLDAIRETNVTSREAGGITQHIGAYVVEINGEKITFLDTPGHEAFTSMRMRGAKSTDIAILVVAADDGVMPQTIEAINHAKAAGVQIIVAINKIDKPSANVERVKQELTEYELIAEDWGGDTIFVPVSAHTKEGIDRLLEMILLTSEMIELKANPNRFARGIVIEAELDKGRGPVATILVQKGTLHVGDNVAVGASFGKVRAMMDDKGRRVKEAVPSTPVEILGLNEVPDAGEIITATNSEKEARTIAEAYLTQGREKLLADTKAKLSLDGLFSQIQAGNIKDLNLVIKADVQGSAEALKQSLVKLTNEEVAVRVIHTGVGAINESDVILASASNAIIIGFNVKPDNAAKERADRENVDVKLYRVIYNAINDVEAAMKGMLDPVFEERIIGHADIRMTFKASGVGTIAGSYVLDGKVVRGSKVRVYRDNSLIYEGTLASLKRFQDDVKEVATGYECGLVFDKFNDVREGDKVELYMMVEVPR